MRRLIEVLAVGVTDDSGNPLQNGTVHFYDAGTTNLRTVYQDFAETSTEAHDNPATLDAAGRLIAYSSRRIKLVIRSSEGDIVRTIDNVGTADSDLSTATASDLAGSGLTAPGDGTLAVNPDGTTLEINSDEVRVKDGGLSAAKRDATTTYAADELLNYSVACSVGSNALTIALKSNAGTDCTATDYATIAFRSTTLTSGVSTRVTVTGALSIVISSGSTLGHVSAAEWPIYVYAINNAGTVELAVSSSPKDERYRLTTTALTGGGSDDSVSAIYSTTSRANVAIRLIAVLKSTQTTAGTWAVVPTDVSNPIIGSPLASLVSRPAHTTVGVGGVAVSASCANYGTTSGSYTDVTNLSVTITTTGRPVWVGLASDGNGSDIAAVCSLNSVSTSSNCKWQILRDSTVIGIYGLSQVSTTIYDQPVTGIQVLDRVSAGTYTYKVQAKSDGTDNCALRYAVLVAYEI